MATDALKTLHTAMLDTREGYEVAGRDATTPALKALFAEMIALRDKDHADIHRALYRDGDRVEDGGSYMGTLHKTLTSVRSMVTGIDTDALSPFIRGEEKIVETYDAAIEEALEDAATRDMLTEQQTTLLAKIADMRAMKST